MEENKMLRRCDFIVDLDQGTIPSELIQKIESRPNKEVDITVAILDLTALEALNNYISIGRIIHEIKVGVILNGGDVMTVCRYTDSTLTDILRTFDVNDNSVLTMVLRFKYKAEASW